MTEPLTLEPRSSTTTGLSPGAARLQIEALTRWYIQREFETESVEWQQILAKYSTKISAALAEADRRASLGTDGSSDAPQDSIERLWGQQWRDNIRLNRDYFLPQGAAGEYSWGSRAFTMRNAGGTLARILSLAAVLTDLQPSTVLEVGSGDGLNLMFLASFFPNIQFTGIELTQAGVDVARDFQKQSFLPEEMTAMFSQRAVDRSAFRRIAFGQGSARELPFPTNHFDVVLTCVALEQMETIRDTALREVARVANSWTAMIEPFRDFNAQGMRRSYIQAYNYFAGNVEDLRSYGLQPLHVSDDLPQKLNLHAGLVVSRKQ